MFTLNPHSGLPIYRQLLEQIRRLVASGQLAVGTPLPSIRELAVKHAINPMTVSKVYTLLEAEGVLERHRGRPMTVAARPRACVPAEKRTPQGNNPGVARQKQ
jgi:GntR family transcriptional regulator